MGNKNIGGNNGSQMMSKREMALSKLKDVKRNLKQDIETITFKLHDKYKDKFAMKKKRNCCVSVTTYDQTISDW